MPSPEVEPYPGIRKWLFYPFVRYGGMLLFTLLGPYRVRGAYRVPRSGGVLILSNHRADVDPPFLQVACPRPIYFMSKSELFDIPVLGFILRIAAAFPVKRGEPDRAALRTAAAIAKEGHAVCIFPEGQLTETGELQEIKAGVSLVIRLADVPVICVGLRHTERIIPYGRLIPRPSFRTLEATWGEARHFPKDTPQTEILGWIEGQLRELSEG